MESSEELLQIADRLDRIVEEASKPAIQEPLDALIEAAHYIEKAWSGSSIGYHANVYYVGLEPAPPGAHFSARWGLYDRLSQTSGDWKEYGNDQVVSTIHKIAKNPDLTGARESAKSIRRVFDNEKSEILSILTTEISKNSDSFLDRLKEDVEKLSPMTTASVTKLLTPSGAYITGDSIASDQGIRIAPHHGVIAEVMSLRNPKDSTRRLGDLARKAGSHLARQLRRQRKIQRVGTNVFIGHGRSLMWRELKDFIEDRLRLPVDEFNRVPVAGITNIARLSEMLDAAAIAFLIMTGEDEQPDGKLHARMNVIHEAGLFQGRLGFTRAIILLEERCEPFTNIEGLGQIRFPPSNIKAAFEEIRQVLEREGVIGPE